jgi:POT family proton-dependent oligopeptide transporter
LVGLAVLVAPFLAFRSILRHPATSEAERVRVRGYRWIFACSAVFWALFSQSTTVLTMFVQLHTDREVLGALVPTGWFQSLHPLFVLAGAPIAAALWPRLGTRAGVSLKFAAGLALAGVAYLVMAVAVLSTNGQVAPGWLVATYFLQSAGELALAPIGLSLTVAIAPAAFTSQMMGVWWLSAALGAAVGGQTAGLFGALGAAEYFGLLGLVPIGVAAALIVFRARLERVLAV